MRIKSIKNSNDLIGKGTRDIPNWAQCYFLVSVSFLDRKELSLSSLAEKWYYEYLYSYGEDKNSLDQTRDWVGTKQRRHYFNPTHASNDVVSPSIIG